MAKQLTNSYTRGAWRAGLNRKPLRSHVIAWLLAASILFLPYRVRAQVANASALSGQVTTPFGGPASSAQVLICAITAQGAPCSTAGITLYSDYNLTQAQGNPLSTDNNGNYKTFITAGLYQIQITLAGSSAPNFVYYQAAGPANGADYVLMHPSASQTVTQPAGTSLTVNTFNSSSGALNGTLGATTPNTVAGTTGNFSGNVTAPSFTGHLIGNADTATQLAATPTGCSANLFATSIVANGDLGCTAITGAALPAPGASTLGGVFSSTAPANEFATGINISGDVTYAQVLFSNLGGTLTSTQVAAAGTLSNSTTGNAGTSTALAATPTACPVGHYATGVDANGNAICSSLGITQTTTVTGCNFASDGANLTCTNTVTLPVAMPDTSYYVECSGYVNFASYPASCGPVINFIEPIVVGSTTSYSFTEVTQGSSCAYPTFANYGQSYICNAVHP